MQLIIGQCIIPIAISSGHQSNGLCRSFYNIPTVFRRVKRTPFKRTCFKDTPRRGLCAFKWTYFWKWTAHFVRYGKTFWNNTSTPPPYKRKKKVCREMSIATIGTARTPSIRRTSNYITLCSSDKSIIQWRALTRVRVKGCVPTCAYRIA